MGAAAEWRRSAYREERLRRAALEEVDPAVAAELQRRGVEAELVKARRSARRYRQEWGWDKRDRQLAKSSGAGRRGGSNARRRGRRS
jgi:hypothetical protein